jgi:hypothetical protein
MPLSAEMDSLQAEIGCNEGFMSGRHPQNGRIIANTNSDGAIFLRQFSNTGKQRFF